jgi:hypothetical protein
MFNLNKPFFLLSFILIIAIISVSCNKEDACEKITCMNGGACQDGTCDCPDGFTGDRCEIEDRCITQNISCLNGGTCQDGTCDCPDGFTGDRCEIEDRCITQNISCLNGGTCQDGVCDCPDGFIGNRCERVDLSKVQDLLNRGITPKTLIDAGVPIDALYGKIYERGIIFYINPGNGTGLVARLDDMRDFRGDRIEAQWGCVNTDIPNLPNVLNNPMDPEIEVGSRIGDGESNTTAILAACSTPNIAARLCRDIGDEYFLPSRGELNAMFTNLRRKGYGGFANNWYLSSSEFQYDGAWVQNFDSGATQRANKAAPVFYVRAAKAFR